MTTKKFLLLIVAIAGLIGIGYTYKLHLDGEKRSAQVLSFQNSIVGNTYVSVSEYKARQTFGDRVKVTDRNDVTITINSNLFLELYVGSKLFGSSRGETWFMSNGDGPSVIVFYSTGGSVYMSNSDTLRFKFYQEDGYYYFRLSSSSNEYQEFKLRKVEEPK